jgi:hypothetical protein
MNETRHITVGGRRYQVRALSKNEEAVVSGYLCKFRTITSPPSVRKLYDREHLHVGWDFAEPDTLLLPANDWRILDQSSTGGFGMTLIITDVVDVWICHIRGVREEEGSNVRVWRGGSRGLKTSGLSTGPHWHVHFTPKNQPFIYLLPEGVINALTRF